MGSISRLVEHRNKYARLADFLHEFAMTCHVPVRPTVANSIRPFMLQRWDIQGAIINGVLYAVWRELGHGIVSVVGKQEFREELKDNDAPNCQSRDVNFHHTIIITSADAILSTVWLADTNKTYRITINRPVNTDRRYRSSATLHEPHQLHKYSDINVYDVFREYYVRVYVLVTVIREMERASCVFIVKLDRTC